MRHMLVTARPIRSVLCALAVLACAAGPQPALAQTNAQALSPPLGWTTWTSLQTDLDEASVKAIAQIQASLLKDSGYVYVNVDGGWYLNPDLAVDAHGRWIADPAKFPGGMAALGDYIHGLGLKFGIYVTPGIPMLAAVYNVPIEGTPYQARDIAITDRTQDTYLGGTMFYIDYAKPGAQEFINSWANLFASWGVDYVKLDAVGQWNLPDINAWSNALRLTGRPMHLTLSNNLNPALAGVWRQAANGWRVSPDIEAYDDTGLTKWDNVDLRFAVAPYWLGAGGSGGWNDLDSLIVGGTDTGLTGDERQTMATLWTISASPLIIGDDLRTLDPLGLSLLTNPEAIAMNQSGVAAAPLNIQSDQQVWTGLGPDGSYTVGLFNLGSSPAAVSVKWADLGFTGWAAVRNVWSRSNLGAFDSGFSANLAPHASMLLRVIPALPVQRLLAPAGTLSAWASVRLSPVSPLGRRVQHLGFGSTLTFQDVKVAAGGWYDVTINYVNGDAAPRAAAMTVNGWPYWLAFPNAGDWNGNARTQGITQTVLLASGSNTIAFKNPFGWAPELASITVQPQIHTGGSYYKIVSAATGRLLEDALASSTPETPAIQWPDSGGSHQHWRMVPTDGASHTFINRLSGLALDVHRATSDAGLPAVQRPDDGSASQRWRVVASGTGPFVLVNRATGLLLHASLEWNGLKVDQWPATGEPDEHWILVPVM